MEHFGYVMATLALVEGKKKVGFMYREKGKGDDSGWRFFAGDEDQDYVDNPDNIRIYDIQTIIDLDKSIKPYLNSAENTAFEMDSNTDHFIMVEDFAFGDDMEDE